MRFLLPVLYCICTIRTVYSAGVVGTAFGMATGTTGGGSATPAAPSSLAELKTWLSDSTARVILIDRTFDFTGTEGTSTSDGCYQKCDVSAGGQDYIGTISCDSSRTAKSGIKYDTAGPKALKVASNKSIVGVGSAGVIKGKGLAVSSATNVIIQNIHFTNINPSHVWGGDALLLENTDKVWVDHNKFSLIGRQMIVTGYGAAGHVTISYNEFDGNTAYAALCDKQHYWTLLLYGAKDYYTFYGNYLHHVSGRAPHLGSQKSGTSVLMHAVNNYWVSVNNHAFDAEILTQTVFEANVFSSVANVMTSASTTRDNSIFNVPSGSESTCTSYIGRPCVLNSATNTITASKETAALSALAAVGSKYIVTPRAVSTVASHVLANAGVGKLSSSTVSSSTAAASSTSSASTCATKYPLAKACFNDATSVVTSSSGTCSCACTPKHPTIWGVRCRCVKFSISFYMVFSSTSFITDSSKLSAWQTSFETAVEKAIGITSPTVLNPGVDITSFASTNNVNKKGQYLISMDVFGACDDSVISVASATAVSSSSYASAKGYWNQVSALAKNSKSVFYTFQYVDSSGTSVASLVTNGTDWDTYPGDDYSDADLSGATPHTLSPSVFLFLSLVFAYVQSLF